MTGSHSHGSVAGAAMQAGDDPWDSAADGWNRNSARIGDWLHDITDAMLDAAQIGPGSRVLDIAAGAGEQTLAIANRVGDGGSVLATDISARMMALAQANLAAAGMTRIGTRVADAQALGLDGAGFDAAVCRLGLMFCPSPLDALIQAHAALRPGGRFSAVVFSSPERNPCIAILNATARKHAGLPAVSPFQAGSLLSLGKPGLLEHLFGVAHFVRIEVRPVSAPFRLPTPGDYLDFVRSSASPIIDLLAPLPATAQRDAWDDMAEQLAAFTGPTGWEGPNELLLCAASTAEDQPPRVQAAFPARA